MKNELFRSPREFKGKAIASCALLLAASSAMVACDKQFGDPGVSSNLDENGKAKSVYDGNHFAVVKPGEQANYNQRQVLLHRGKEVYDVYCVGCHGVYGDGKGPAAPRLDTQPRDFTKGIYKFRSTNDKSLPMEADLHRTITQGLATVSMPEFALMPEPDKAAVIEYIKAFDKDWDTKAPNRVKVHVPNAPTDLKNPDRIARGRGVYLASGCYSCHGTDGGGTGASEVYYKDSWGDMQRPLDFTRSKLKAGDQPEDIYRTFMTGVISIMPTYQPEQLGAVTAERIRSALTEADKKDPAVIKAIEQFAADQDAISKLTHKQRQELNQRNSWDLVAYVMSIMPKPRKSSLKQVNDKLD